MLWLKALESLQAHFIKAAVADEVILGGYNPANVRAKPDGKGILYLMRDRERPASDDLVESVRITLTVDAWVRSDSKEMHEGYEALARLERALMDALRRYASQMRELAWRMGFGEPCQELYDAFVADDRGSAERRSMHVHVNKLVDAVAGTRAVSPSGLFYNEPDMPSMEEADAAFARSGLPAEGVDVLIVTTKADAGTARAGRP